MTHDLILASQSPRRQELLSAMGLQLQCLPVNIDESPHKNEAALEYCERLAREKAIAGQKLSSSKLPVLGSDTIVVVDEELLGKPKDEGHALQTLKKLSGRSHQVITSVSVVQDQQIHTLSSISDVTFKKLTDSEILNYIETGEPMDKAGAYAIQGLAALWIKHISGSYSGIMGLPLYETSQILKKFNINVL